MRDLKPRYLHVSLLLALFILLSPQIKAQGVDLESTVQSLLSFTVPTLTTQELKAELENGEKIILLDARAPREYEVSHLADAHFVGFDEFKKKYVADFPRDEKVVVYCTVGYRSEKISERLQKLGFENVRNLYGGICDWVNQENTVVNPAGEETEKVHTYNEDWGRLFIKGQKVYE